MALSVGELKMGEDTADKDNNQRTGRRVKDDADPKRTGGSGG